MLFGTYISFIYIINHSNLFVFVTPDPNDEFFFLIIFLLKNLRSWGSYSYHKQSFWVLNEKNKIKFNNKTGNTIMFGWEFVEHIHIGTLWIIYSWHITRLLVINAKYNDLSFGHTSLYKNIYRVCMRTYFYIFSIFIKV